MLTSPFLVLASFMQTRAEPTIHCIFSQWAAIIATYALHP